MEDLHVGEVILWLSSFFSKFQHENVIKTSLFSPQKLPRIQYQLSRTEAIHRATDVYVVSSNIRLKQRVLIFPEDSSVCFVPVLCVPQTPFVSESDYTCLHNASSSFLINQQI